jgi:pimeloyl-ACP methyl ester carboxylesterase
VRVVESGVENARSIVLVPGWGCTAWIFHETLSPLATAGFHAIAVELKGHGESDKPSREEEYTSAAMRDHLLEILDALGVDSAGVVGHSMGAAIAAHAAVAAPARVSGLVLAAPVGFAGVRGMWLFRLLTPRFAIPVLRRLATRSLIRIMLSVVYGSLRRASNQDVEEFYAPTRMPGTTRALRHLLHAFKWDAQFPKLEVPFMTIFGSEDVLSPSGNASLYGGIRTVIIDGSGHVLFDEAPGIVNGAIAEFFAAPGAPYISSQND